MDEASAKRNITDESVRHFTRVEELAYELRIREVMTREVQALSPETPMAQALETFRGGRISGAPVVVDGRLIGVLSLDDVIRWLRHAVPTARVGAYMSNEVITAQADDLVVEALKTFTRSRVGRLPVLNAEGKLIGILTKGDITQGLLRALQSDFQAEEVRRYRASHLFEDIISDRTSLILRYTIKPRDFSAGGQASGNIKRALLRLGATPQVARRCGIASYEAEMNLVIHTTRGGTIWVEIQPDSIFMEAIDDGPGIADTALARQPGWSTAPEEIRELGFGAGMGLPNIERCVDEMTLESTPHRGTRLAVKIYLGSGENFERPSVPKLETMED